MGQSVEGVEGGSEGCVHGVVLKFMASTLLMALRVSPMPEPFSP